MLNVESQRFVSTHDFHTPNRTTSQNGILPSSTLRRRVVVHWVRTGRKPLSHSCAPTSWWNASSSGLAFRAQWRAEYRRCVCWGGRYWLLCVAIQSTLRLQIWLQIIYLRLCVIVSSISLLFCNNHVYFLVNSTHFLPTVLVCWVVLIKLKNVYILIIM